MPLLLRMTKLPRNRSFEGAEPFAVLYDNPGQLAAISPSPRTGRGARGTASADASPRAVGARFSLRLAAFPRPACSPDWRPSWPALSPAAGDTPPHTILRFVARTLDRTSISDTHAPRSSAPSSPPLAQRFQTISTRVRVRLKCSVDVHNPIPSGRSITPSPVGSRGTRRSHANNVSRRAVLVHRWIRRVFRVFLPLPPRCRGKPRQARECRASHVCRSSCGRISG
jgi:hypothetical protein